MPQLDFLTYSAQIFWLIVSFLLLYVFISQFAVPSIEKTLSARSKRRSDDLTEADLLQNNAQTLQNQLTKSLEEARANIAKKRDDINLKSKKIESEKMSLVEKEISQKEQEFNEKSNQFNSELNIEFSHLVSDISSEIMKKIYKKSA